MNEAHEQLITAHCVPVDEDDEQLWSHFKLTDSDWEAIVQWWP
jgi:hypothetical protein